MTTLQRDRRLRPRRELERLLSNGEPDVVDCALWIAAEEYPAMDVAREAHGVRRLATIAAKDAAALTNPFARIDALRHSIYGELGFRGNKENYHDPRNSYLNEVIRRRLGIPLTMSIVFMESARSAGFEVRGVGLPGHFVCSVTLEGRTILVDPFHGAQVLTEDDCRDLVARSTGRSSLFCRRLLDGVDARAMLGRLLLNLKQVFLGRGDHERALAAVERLLMVRPTDFQEIRDRGLLKGHMGRAGAAITDLETYLALAPEAIDVESVRGRLQWLRRRVSQVS